MTAEYVIAMLISHVMSADSANLYTRKYSTRWLSKQNMPRDLHHSLLECRSSIMTIQVNLPPPCFHPFPLCPPEIQLHPSRLLASSYLRPLAQHLSPIHTSITPWPANRQLADRLTPSVPTAERTTAPQTVSQKMLVPCLRLHVYLRTRDSP